MKTVVLLIAGLSLLVHDGYAANKKKFEIEFIESYGVNVCNVIFYSKIPKPNIVDEVLMCSLKTSVTIDSSRNISASAFLDEQLLSEQHYAGRLIFIAKDKKILTYEEYRGTKKHRIDMGSYVLSVEERKRLVRPEEKYLSVKVVFPKKPSRDKAYKAMIETVNKYKGRNLEISLYVYVGDKNNERSWRQIKDTDGSYMFANYEPKSRILRRNQIIIHKFK